nr:glycosyltransferase 87 family protein [Wenjunlia tyrosinilytica]
MRQKGFYGDDPGALLWWYGASWTVFACAFWAVRAVPTRHAAALVLVGGIAVAATGLLGPPRTSTDSYRYAWDGRVQASGTSPYDHAPDARELAPLRDSWLFPATCEGRGLSRSGDLCTRINRPSVHTIYPPVAEGWFLAVHALSPPHARHKPLQIGGAVLSLATTGALLAVLRRRGAPQWAALWAWCPAVPIEAVNNAHVDSLGILLTVVGLGAVNSRGAVGGALLGAATAAKLLPAVVIPGALSGARPREAAKAVLSAAGVVALAYLPYALVSHSSVLGYLSGYVHEEGYEDSSSKNPYALLRLVLPPSWAFPVVVVAMAAVVLHVLRRADPERPWHGALLVTGTAFLLLTPGYPWYALLVVALAALDGRWEWLGIPIAGAAHYVCGPAGPDRTAVGTTAYALAAAAVVAGGAIRRRRADAHGGQSAKAAEPRPRHHVHGAMSTAGPVDPGTRHDVEQRP